MKLLSVFILSLLLAGPAFGGDTKHHHKKHHRHWSKKHYAKKHRRGLKRHSDWRQKKMALPHVSFAKAPEEIPKSASTVSCAPWVENQGQCGSCWDFSLTETLRDSIACNGAGDPGRLSFMFLLDCATEQAGCNGGDFNAAQHMVSPGGPPTFSSWPYTGSDGGSCKSSLQVAASAVGYHMLGEGGVPSFKDIAYVISQMHQPVSVDVAADDAWESYGGGEYAGCDAGASGINHMVIISAYDCETAVDKNGACVFDAKGNLPPGVGTFTVKNSWNTDWGQGGFMVSQATGPDGAKCNALATDALYYDVAPKPQPTPPAPTPPTPKPRPGFWSQVWGFVVALFAWL